MTVDNTYRHPFARAALLVLAGLASTTAFAAPTYLFRLDAPGLKAPLRCPATTKTFGFTGALQQVSIPGGCTQVKVTVSGAGGGTASNGVHGRGGFVIAVLATGGETTLSVLVGQGGIAGADGGGRSAVLDGAGNALVVAGGGGGGILAGNGGSPATAADTNHFEEYEYSGGGGGATQAAPGAGGVANTGERVNGLPGSGHNGGGAGYNYGGGGVPTRGAQAPCRPAGGGGGGYYGGGQGSVTYSYYYLYGYQCHYAGGGGGSSYAAPSATGVVMTTGGGAYKAGADPANGQVVVSWGQAQ